MGSAAPRNCAHTALMDGSLRPIVDEDRGEHPSLFTMTQTKRIDSFLTFLHALAPTATACFPCPSCLSRRFRQPNMHSIVLCPLPWLKPSDEKKKEITMLRALAKNPWVQLSLTQGFRVSCCTSLSGFSRFEPRSDTGHGTQRHWRYAYHCETASLPVPTDGPTSAPPKTALLINQLAWLFSLSLFPPVVPPSPHS